MSAASLVWLVMLASPAASAGDFPGRPEELTLTGKVVDLAPALRAAGLTVDAGPIAKQVGLLGKDNTLTPLLSDDASRAFFLDPRLRDRPAELKVRKFPRLPYLQVLSFKIEYDGKLRTPEYYCEICTIHVRYPQICPCCQGPMVLQMKPEGR
jgi:hypothetical protein